MNTLEQHLGELPFALLRGIAQNQGLILAEGTRKGAVLALVVHMSDGAHAREVWQSLSTEARVALQALAAADNRIPAPTFQRRFGELRRFGPGSLERERPWAAPVNVAEFLWYRGLITRGFDETADGLVECISIPTDLLPLLPIPAATNASFPPLPVSPPPHVESAGETFLEDLGTLLIYVQNEPVWLNQRRQWRDKDLRLLARQWQRPPADDEPLLAAGGRAALLFHCAQRLGFLSSEGRRQRLRGKQVRSWLQLDRFEQSHALYLAWRDTPAWNDLCLTPGLTCVEGNWRNDPVQTRVQLVHLLGQVESLSWYALSEFIAAVHEHAPDFQRPDGNFDMWYIKDPEGVYLKGFEHWHDVEGRLLRYVCTGPLFWLGAIALDEARGRWCLTPLGVAHLGLGTPPVTEALPVLVIGEDFRVVAPTGAGLYDRFRVARFCEWEAGWPGYRYRITQRGLRRAAAAGITLVQIIDFLARASGDRLPVKVREALTAFRP